MYSLLKMGIFQLAMLGNTRLTRGYFCPLFPGGMAALLRKERTWRAEIQVPKANDYQFGGPLVF